MFSRSRLACLAFVVAVTAVIVPAATVATPAGVVAPSDARWGDRSAEVRAVQARLAEFGYTVKVDGIYGPQTHRAVTHFQRANGLKPDGIVGPLTTKALRLDGGATATAPAVRSVTPIQVTPVYLYFHRDPNVERWHQAALDVGWPEERWKWLSCVIYRESRGNPRAFNGRGRDESYGLVQINAKAHRARMIAHAGTVQAFFDPKVNLSFALMLYNEQGTRPWRAQKGSC